MYVALSPALSPPCIYMEDPFIDIPTYRPLRTTAIHHILIPNLVIYTSSLLFTFNASLLDAWELRRYVIRKRRT